MSQVTLRPNEKIRLTVRRHWITLAIPFLFSLLVIVLDFFLLFPLFSLGLWGLALFVLFLMFALAVSVRAAILWYSTAFLITNQRVIDVDRKNVFRWVISDVTFDNMADISYETSGPLQAVFRAGNVQVMTISGSQVIELEFVPDPGRVREIIMEELAAARNTLSPSPEQTEGAALSPDDVRALGRYADHLKKRNEMKKFFGDQQ